MEPDAILRNLLDAVESADVGRVDALASQLRHWLQSGGYPPKTIGKWKLGQEWHEALALHVCELAKTYVRGTAARRRGRNEPSS